MSFKYTLINRNFYIQILFNFIMSLNKKLIIVFVIGMLFFPLISSISIDVQKKSSKDVYIPELNNKLKYTLLMTNNGDSDIFSINNLVGISINPNKEIQINSGETKELNLTVYPLTEIKEKGPYIFSYFLKGKKDKNVQEHKLSFNIVPLNEVFEVGATNLNPESDNINVYIKNKVDYEFKNLNANFESPFFNVTKTFSLKPFEIKNFTVTLDKTKFKKLKAGFYALNAKIKIGTKITKTSNIINFKERDILDISEKEYGFFIHTKVIRKQNNGNIDSESITIINKSIISRLFTSFSPAPNSVERNKGIVKYTWIEELSPGEEIEINIKTNWLFPFLLILFVIIVVALVKQYLKNDLVLKKKISFVKAKGGEFGLKVTITASAKSFIENIKLIDRLPAIVKLYEKFLYEKPKNIDEKKRLIEWRIEKLQPGEKRTFSYFIYSKVGILGRFALPSAIAFYEKDGNKKESTSNRAFFITDQKSKEE